MKKELYLSLLFFTLLTLHLLLKINASPPLAPPPARSPIPSPRLSPSLSPWSFFRFPPLLNPLLTSPPDLSSSRTSYKVDIFWIRRINALSTSIPHSPRLSKIPYSPFLLRLHPLNYALPATLPSDHKVAFSLPLDFSNEFSR